MGKKSAISDTLKFAMNYVALKEEGMHFFISDTELLSLNDVISADNELKEITVKNSKGQIFNKQKKVWEDE